MVFSKETLIVHDNLSMKFVECPGLRFLKFNGPRSEIESPDHILTRI